MAFKLGNTAAPPTGATPAAKLHGRYNKITGGFSNITDWKTILTRGVSYDEADCLINYLEAQPHGRLPASKNIVTGIKAYLAYAAMDPVAQRYGVTVWANELAEILDREGNTVPPEYLQKTKDEYTSYLSAMAKVCEAVWLKLPPPSLFVREWFEVTARYGSLRMRHWSPKHPKFRQYVLAHFRAAGIFSYSLLEDERLV